MDWQPAGFIGLGAMGAGMAGNLLRAGVPLRVADASPDAVARLTAQGASAAPTPAALAAEVQVLFLCLPYTPQVEAVLFGEDGVTAGSRHGLTVIDTTTLNHQDALALAGRAEAAGLRYCDCPISGGPGRAADGTLTMMLGGTEADFALARPYLEAMGEHLVHCGAVGMGQVAKAVNNIIYNVNIAALAEVMPLALEAGLEPEALLEIVTTGSSSSFASRRFAERILDRKFDGDYSMRSAYKDIVNVQQIATRLEAATPVVNAMVATYQQAMAAGFAGEAKSAMVKVYERVLGMEARRSAAGAGPRPPASKRTGDGT